MRSSHINWIEKKREDEAVKEMAFPSEAPDQKSTVDARPFFVNLKPVNFSSPRLISSLGGKDFWFYFSPPRLRVGLC